MPETIERPDLANELIRETYRPKNRLKLWGQRDPLALRRAVAHAKRFSMDDPMAAFMGELALVPFKGAKHRRPEILDSLRHSARLPFPQMFIQYDYRAFRRGLRTTGEVMDIRHQPLSAPDEMVVGDIGWLIEADTRDPDLIWLAEYFEIDGHIQTLPFRFCWRTDDRGFAPGLQIDARAGMFAHGIEGHFDPNIGVQYTKPLAAFPKDHLTEIEGRFMRGGGVEHFEVHSLVPEFGGVVRYALVLLATLNDIPKLQMQVRPAKSYLGGGQIRKYLDYTTLRLTLPVNVSTTTLAKRLIAASRKGWHEVRPHWRINHPPLGAKFCDNRIDHLWLEADETGHANCKLCDARRIWIVLPTGRGDPSISVRTHKYALHHSED